MGSGLARPSSEWRRGRQPPARRRSPRGRAERGHHRAPATSEAAQHTRASRAQPPPRTTRSGAAHRRGCAATRAHLDLRRAPKQYLKHRCAGTGLTSGVAGPAPSCAPPPPLQRLAGGFRRPELLGGAGTACATINNYAGTPTDFLPLLAEASVVMSCYSTRCAFFSKSCTPSSFFAAGRRGHVWRRAGLHSFHFAMSNEHANE